jgi:hypothetical protein
MIKKRIKSITLFFLALSTVLSSCAPTPTRENLKIYIAISTKEQHIEASHNIVKNSLFPLGYERRFPWYVIIDDIASETKEYDKIWEGQPLGSEVLHYQKVIDTIQPTETTHHDRILVALNRLLFSIKQDNSNRKFRAIIILSGFNPLELDSKQKDRLRYLVKEIISYQEKLELLCLVGTVTGPTESLISDYFSIEEKFVVSDVNRDNKFSRRCLR